MVCGSGIALSLTLRTYAMASIFLLLESRRSRFVMPCTGFNLRLELVSWCRSIWC